MGISLFNIPSILPVYKYLFDTFLINFNDYVYFDQAAKRGLDTIVEFASEYGGPEFNIDKFAVSGASKVGSGRILKFCPWPRSLIVEYQISLQYSYYSK